MTYKKLRDEITRRVVTIPDGDHTVESLSAWLSGYAQCQHEILDLIQELEEGDPQDD